MLGTVVAVVTLVLGGCGGSEDAESADYAVDLMRQRLDVAGGSTAHDSLLGALPNTVYRGADGTSAPVSVSVVLGRVQRAEAGRAFVADDVGEAERVSDAAFDDPAAEWVTVHTRFAQDEVVVGTDLAEDGSLTLAIAAAPGIDPATFGESLYALGTVVVFIDRDSPVFDYEQGLLSIAGDGAMVADGDEEGNMMLPFVEPLRHERGSEWRRSRHRRRAHLPRQQERFNVCWVTNGSRQGRPSRTWVRFPRSRRPIDHLVGRSRPSLDSSGRYR